MNKPLQQVHTFFNAVNQKTGDYTDPKFPNEASINLGLRLIEEEVVQELIEAIKNRDMVATADGIADSIFVILGFAVRCGINIGPIWEEVVRTNMLKVSGPVCPDTGKRGKPEGFKPPDIQALLDAQKLSSFQEEATVKAAKKLFKVFLDNHDDKLGNAGCNDFLMHNHLTDEEEASIRTLFPDSERGEYLLDTDVFDTLRKYFGL